mmetsp:Transcript_29233/g.89437  ORF Transcript_29233/g.89437 Transcript_29233/m.89437 type:complete len:595 (-) Transcript_29233:39-1823(-)
MANREDEAGDQTCGNALETPKEYFLKCLLGHGIKIDPMSFRNPASPVSCVALKFRTEDELPQMYDKELLEIMYDGSLEEVRHRVQESGEVPTRVVNAQNTNGETVLMKVCRRTLTKKQSTHDNGLRVVSLLLKSGANPSVCCDSGKNVLHDVFWTAKPPPDGVLRVMEKLVHVISRRSGKHGILELLLSQDKHGYTPLDYVIPVQQPNWRQLFDAIIAWITASGEDSSSRADASDYDSDDSGALFLSTTSCNEQQQQSGGVLSEDDDKSADVTSSVVDRQQQQQQRRGESPPTPPRRDVPEQRRPLLELETSHRELVSNVIADAYPDDQRLLAQLCAHSASFLMSNCADPDAMIVAVSPNFVAATGYSSDDVLGRNCRFLQGPGTSTKQVGLVRRALAREATVRVSLLNYRKSGESFLNNFLLTPLRSRTTGKAAFFFGVQNCPDSISQDRRRRLSASGSEWIDDDADDDDDDSPPQGGDSTSGQPPPPSSSSKEEDNGTDDASTQQQGKPQPADDDAFTLLSLPSTTTLVADAVATPSTPPKRDREVGPLSPAAQPSGGKKSRYCDAPLYAAKQLERADPRALGRFSDSCSIS